MLPLQNMCLGTALGAFCVSSLIKGYLHCVCYKGEETKACPAHTASRITFYCLSGFKVFAGFSSCCLPKERMYAADFPGSRNRRNLKLGINYMLVIQSLYFLHTKNNFGKMECVVQDTLMSSRCPDSSLLCSPLLLYWLFSIDSPSCSSVMLNLPAVLHHTLLSVQFLER